MKQGAAHELIGSERHRFVSIPFLRPVVLPRKRLESVLEYRESPGFPGGLQPFAGQ